MWMLFLPYVSLAALWILVFRVYAPWRRPEESIRSAVLKCLPVLYLGLLTAVTPAVSQDHARLRRYITVGLLCSIGGDWCLVFQKRFIHGLSCFAVAMGAYVAAVGVSPLEPDVSAVAFAAYALVMMIALSRRVNNITLNIAVVVYVFLICFMGWRATVYHMKIRSPTSLAVQLGALMFMVSDTCIAVNRWLRPWPRSNICIVITYYIAQALFATAVLWPSYNFVSRRMNVHM